MVIVIDLAESRVLLRDPSDFSRFSVALDGEGDLAAVVHQSGLGRLTEPGDHMVVDPVAVRALAGSAATDEWVRGFTGMCEYAAAKGWVEADGGIVAHVERRGEAD